MKKHTFILSALALSLFAFSTGTLAAITFTDVPTNHWAAGAIEYVANTGLMKGDEGKSTFRLNDEVTRAELAIVVRRQDEQMKTALEKLENRIEKLEGKEIPAASPVSEKSVLNYKKDFIEFNYPNHYKVNDYPNQNEVSLNNAKGEVVFVVEWATTDEMKNRLSDYTSSNEELTKKAINSYGKITPIETEKIAGLTANKITAEAGCDSLGCQPKKFVVFSFYNPNVNKIYILKFFEPENIEFTKDILNSIKFNAEAWTSAGNHDLNFSLRYPKNWIASEGESFGNYHMFFTNELTKESFGILPKGELDTDLPQASPVVTQVVLDGRKATKSEWKLENEKVLVRIKFSEYPASWNADNRLEFSGSKAKLADFEDILSTFHFTD